MTAAAIKEQEAAGLDLVTDGQIRWQDPITYATTRLQGLEVGGLLRWFESNTYFRQPRPSPGIELAWTGPILREDLEFARLAARLTGCEHAKGELVAVLDSDNRLVADGMA